MTDGSEAYRAVILDHLGHATHVVDRFHVVRWFATGLVEVRRRLQRRGPKGTRPAFCPEVFRSRYPGLRRYDRLTAEEAARLGRVLEAHPELERGWRMLQHLHGLYLAEDREQADLALAAFADLYGEGEPLGEFYGVVKALLGWATEIFAFHVADRVTNGRLEGINAKLGVLKRIAYGFTNASNLGARALLLCPGAGMMT